jgi:hypothetical protein
MGAPAGDGEWRMNPFARFSSRKAFSASSSGRDSEYSDPKGGSFPSFSGTYLVVVQAMRWETICDSLREERQEIVILQRYSSGVVDVLICLVWMTPSLVCRILDPVQLPQLLIHQTQTPVHLSILALSTSPILRCRPSNCMDFHFTIVSLTGLSWSLGC